MPSRTTPILNFKDVEDKIVSDQDHDQYFHAFGIFRKEEISAHWILFDEYKEIRVKLNGPLTDYPRPKPGDVVRIHRLGIHKTYKIAESKLGRNVVYWESVVQNPTPISTAKNPTISAEDTERVRVLQVYLFSRIVRIKPLKELPIQEAYFDFVAGCVETAKIDTYGHMEIVFNDGTDVAILRVFDASKFPTKKQEVDDHFRVAKQLVKGQYILASNVKYDYRRRFNLSASLEHGRSLRLVEPSSIIGVKLAELQPTLRPESEPGPGTSSSTESSQTQLRRSPRFLTQDSNQEKAPNQDRIPDQDTVPKPNKIPRQDTSPPILDVQTSKTEHFPKYTRFCDIKKTDRYAFYDLVGRVHDRVQFDQYGHAIVPIHDGSTHNFINYSGRDHRENCLYVLVYCKQKESDIADHFMKATGLREGDLVHIINVKVSIVDNKLKLELQANSHHNKSLNIIDRDSPFGKKILCDTDILAEQVVPELEQEQRQTQDELDIDPEDMQNGPYMTGE